MSGTISFPSFQPRAYTDLGERDRCLDLGNGVPATYTHRRGPFSHNPSWVRRDF